MAKPAMVAEDEKQVPQSADGWLSEIDRALKREKKWRDKAKKVVDRYRDERSSTSAKGESRVNILWANTEVLKSALYPSTAKADVRRRFPDTPETTVLSRTAAEVVERSVNYAVDVEDVDDPIAGALEDTLLPGRGQCWVSYEPTIGTDSYGVEDITGQKLCLEYVYWEDFVHGKARKWCDVPWGGRRHGMAEEVFNKKFPDAVRTVPNKDYSLDKDDAEDSGEVEVWEIWDKINKKRIYVARGYRDILQDDDDPYQLTGFFPFPQPLFAVTTTEKLTPTPEFLQYQDQANELDVVSTRIRRLTEQLKWKGIYDASMDAGENKLKDLASADDGEFLPYQNWPQLKDKGGIEAGVGFWPMQAIIVVLKELHVQRAQLIQTIYEITGISDIVRGSTDPRETKGAQQLKAQFGSMRMQARQKEVQRFIRDCYRLMAEIIAEHFTQETLAGITGMDLAPAQQPMLPVPMAQLPAPMGQTNGAAPPPSGGAPGMPPGPAGTPGGMSLAGPMGSNASAMPQDVAPTPEAQAKPKPTWDEVLKILRSDKLRSYRIDIETDQTVFQDAEEEKSKRIEFMTAVNEMLEKAYLAATQAPMMLPLIRETFMFAIRSFKAGRVMEQAAEDAFDQLTRSPPKAPQQDNGQAAEAGKLALEGKRLELEAQHKKALFDLDKQDRESRFGLDRDKQQSDIDMEKQKLAVQVAGQNKKLLAESADEMAAEPAGLSPLEAVMRGIGELASVIAQGQAQQGQQFAQLAELIAAPKRIVRGRDGRAEGVQTVALN